MTGRLALSVALALSLVALGATRAESSQTPLSILDLNGSRVDPFGDVGARATILIFLRTDCPVSNRYAPEVRRLIEKFSRAGMRFWLVYPDPDESQETIARHVKEYDYRSSVLRDPDHTLVRLAGVGVTPEAAVFMSGVRRVYRGRIDDRYIDFGRARATPTKRDLEDVLREIAKGRPVGDTTTHAVGCFIPQSR